MTAWSIASVKGVVVSLASMVNVRSNIDRSLHCRCHFEDAPVRVRSSSQHEADRRLAVPVAWQRDRAAIHHVDQRAIAQGEQISLREGLVIGELGNLRR